MRALLCVAISWTAWSATLDKEAAFIGARGKYWAFQRVERPAVPALADAWIRTPIDAFILDALRERNLKPAPPLDRARLLRRVTFDLTGLPPTPAEVDAFLHDRAPGAYEKIVDRLLASPHYGERWALKWLDVVRYADSNGFELDADRVNAWRYRDYVINAFNHDKPYDQFVREQIAGDKLYPGNDEALIATGFARAGAEHLVAGNLDPDVSRQEVLTEIATSVGQTFLGLTVNCARCHNHKFDPILQADYYRLQAVFSDAKGKDVEIATPAQKTAWEAATKPYKERLKPVEEALEKLAKPYAERLEAERTAKLEPALRDALAVPFDKRTAEQKTLAMNAKEQIKPTWDEVLAVMSLEDRAARAKLREQLLKIRTTEPDPLPGAYVYVSTGEPVPQNYVLRMGDPKNPLDPVDPDVPRVLKAAYDATGISSGRRVAFAEWLASPMNPLTARVMVNRIWQFRMGAGIIRTPNDFGVMGDRPSNQALLDWLASEFASRAWSVKTIDRLIVLSNVYQQNSVASNAEAEKADPDNRLLWRMNRKRIEGEALRDATLAVTGSLNPQLFGRPVRIPIEPEVYDLIFTEFERDGLWPVNPDKTVQNRRSIYLYNKRSMRLPLLNAFDQPDAITSCPVRPTSTHALQALSLFNSDFMQEQSRAFAATLERECKHGGRCATDTAWRLALSRRPTPAELKLVRKFRASGGSLTDMCLALLNRNEFVYVP